jgi:hypothetical protein
MTRRFVVSLILPALLLTLPAGPAPRAQAPPSPFRGDLKLPDKNDLGNWDGTWFYVSRDYRMVLWLRTVDGAPQLKLQYMSLASPEGFATDWNGQAEYRVKNTTATFAMAISEGQADEIHGTWDWVLEFGNSSREEHATFRIYRSGDGRSLVVQFEDFSRRVRTGEQVKEYRTELAWTFRKVSKRLVRWEEIFG